MDANPVRRAVTDLASREGFGPVTIDDRAITALATTIAEEPLSLPAWETPAIPDADAVGADTLFDLLVVANALNFQFDHYDTGETFATTYDGDRYTGAFGLLACFTRALAAGTPVTSPSYLANLDREDVAVLLAGEPPMPRLPDRHRILRHVGTRLQALPGDGVYDALQTTGPVPTFDDGDGLVEFLVRAFPAAYNDVRTVDGHTVPFYKKAQLAAALLAGHFGETTHGVTDLGSLTLFADYVIPAVLRDAGVLTYAEDLADRVDDGRVLPVGSAAEVGIRAATVAAGDRLVEAVTDRRTDTVTAVHLDQYLWRSGRLEGVTFHRTPTTSY
ncbi:MAG: queuosine salvage family protein [Halobacteriaceae archaeon]